ncbi:MAG: flagellar basal body rod protein FlgB [Spirochaetaceae bacterium]|jgi:flagellar basal-body rod protein FlgB|nr:flagellar basal body rod protein FlgB [Spirochaetaceae bacterium]
MNSFTQTVDLLHRAMDVSTLRYQVTADNLSKAGVPNYKRKTVSFESSLKHAFEQEAKAKEEEQAYREGKTRFTPSEAVDYRTVQPRLGTDYLTTVKANGNNVDAEQEAMELLKIQMNYQLLAQMQSHEFSQIRTAMRK